LGFVSVAGRVMSVDEYHERGLEATRLMTENGGALNAAWIAKYREDFFSAMAVIFPRLAKVCVALACVSLALFLIRLGVMSAWGKLTG
jgi:hypothetical protein